MSPLPREPSRGPSRGRDAGHPWQVPAAALLATPPVVALAAALLAASVAVLLPVGSVAAQATAPGRAGSGALRAVVNRFWLGAPDAAEAAASEILAGGYAFEEVYRALARTPDYPADPPRGRLDRSRTSADGNAYPYALLVPEGYDPGRAWPVIFYLHGGVNRSAWTEGGGWWRDYERIADPERIVVVPASWNEAPWWGERQIDNLRAILDDVARIYRVDRNRAHLIGVSDGGTGVFYQAFRAPTPWASFVSLIGHPAVLSSPRLAVEGQMHVGNLRARPWLIANGGRDRLYPASSVEPFVGLFRDNGVELVYRPKPEAGHDLGWWPEEAARIDSFLVATSRDPLPDSLEWETEDPARGRLSWVVIDELGAVEGESALPDRNELRVPGESRPYLAFPHREPSGRIVVERSGNRVQVRTRGVRRFRLLVSPEDFDLALPIRVEVNGAVRFEGRVASDVETLLRWAATDRDPTALFAGWIEVEL